MKGELDCIACAVAQMLNTARVATHDPARHKEVLRETMKYLLSVDWNQTPAVISTGAYHLLHNMLGNPDPYREIKRKQNETALKLLPEMRRMIATAKDTLHTAAKLAVIGNIIDCGIRRHHNVVEELKTGMELPMAVDDFRIFRKMFATARKIFYALDNAGEIVFDRVFIEVMKSERPDVEITACVRGGAILNDVLMEDAETVNLSEVARIIDTGITAIGIPLQQVTDELLEEINSSDIILSKGQGNYETLDEITDGRVFFILRAKCPLIASKFNVPLNAIVFKHFTGS